MWTEWSTKVNNCDSVSLKYVCIGLQGATKTCSISCLISLKLCVDSMLNNPVQFSAVSIVLAIKGYFLLLFLKIKMTAQCTNLIALISDIPYTRETVWQKLRIVIIFGRHSSRTQAVTQNKRTQSLTLLWLIVNIVSDALTRATKPQSQLHKQQLETTFSQSCIHLLVISSF